MDLQASDVTAIAGVVVAICALFATIWQAWFTRKQALIGIKPSLHIMPEFSTKRDEQGIYKEIVYHLSNDGLGPAIITKYSYSIDGTLEPDLSEKIGHLALEHFLKTKLTLPPSEILNTAHFSAGKVISANTHYCLLRITTREQNYDKLLSELDRMGLHIEYNDAYGNAQSPLII